MRTMIALLALAGSAFGADSAILNPASPVSAISADQAKDIFLGRKTSWDDGSKIVVVVTESGPGNDALMKLLGKSPSQFATGWKKLVFTGKGVMPESVKDDAAAIAFVAKTPGAIGFVAAAGDGVKAVPVQ